jgi:hypothetical protein
MRRPVQSLATVIAAALLTVGLLAGCAGATPAPQAVAPGEPGASDTRPREPEGSLPLAVVETYQGAPDGVPLDDLAAAEAFALWDAAEAGTLTVVTFGSSSCAPVPVSYDPAVTDSLSVWAEYQGLADVCTADMAATTSVVEVPDGYAPEGGVLVNGSRVAVLP